MRDHPAIGVVILAGGEATRLPGKLELRAPDAPLLVRVYRNVSPGRRTFISCAKSLPPAIDAALDCPKIFDRWERRGPLGGLLSVLEAIDDPLVFAVAGDLPFVDAAFIDRLGALWQEGDEAVVPVHGTAGTKPMEPLAALYAREAFLREGKPVLDARGSLHAVVAKLRVRPYPIRAEESQIFTNVNTPEDYESVMAFMQ